MFIIIFFGGRDGSDLEQEDIPSWFLKSLMYIVPQARGPLGAMCLLELFPPREVFVPFVVFSLL